MKYLLILAMLAQAPKPLPTPPLAVDNHAEPAPILMQDNGRTVMTIRDADIPVGPCDFGKLVRAVKAHVDLEHPVPSDFPLAAYVTTADVRPCRDYGWGTPTCRLEAAQEGVARAKAEVEAEQKRIKILEDLRAELARCSPTPKAGKGEK